MSVTEYLMDFWHTAGTGKYNRLQMLIEASKVRTTLVPDKKRLQVLRDQFVRDHVDRKRYKMALQCWSCGYRNGAARYFLVRHHVISLKNGGVNRRVNIITICSSCHAEIHPWLSKTNW